MVINNKYITNFVNIANAYINLRFWQLYKNLTSIIISKPNKLVYNSPKTFYSIVLFNVVATTRRNSTHSLLTSAKLSVGYLVVGITRELNKEPSLHCSFIYINYMWSMLQQY